MSKANLENIDPESSEGPGWFLYILECRDGCYYVGITNDLEHRVKSHNEGNGAKFTRGRRPVSLIYQERWPNKSAARKREIEVKGWPRKKKEELIGGFLRSSSSG